MPAAPDVRIGALTADSERSDLADNCVAAGLAVWFAFVSPANTEVAGWTAVPLPPDWTCVRRQWEFGHAASAVLDLIGFGAIVVSVLLETPGGGLSRS